MRGRLVRAELTRVLVNAIGAAMLAAVALPIAASPTRAASLPAVVGGMVGAGASLGAGDPDGRGWTFMTLDSANGQICYDVQADGIDVVTSVDLRSHAAPATVLASFDVLDASGAASGCVSVASADIDAIAASPSGFFLEVDTVAFPGHAVAGDLEPAPTGSCLLTQDAGTDNSGSLKYLRTGATLHLLGVGFPANTNIELQFSYGDQNAGSETVTTDASGYFVAYDSFAADEAGFWTITAVGPGGCQSFVQDGVNIGFVGLLEEVCPASIQTVAQLQAAGTDACKRILLPGDGPPPQPGYTTPNYAGEMAFDVEASGPDGLAWDVSGSGAELTGGGTCFPVTHTCFIGNAYRFDWVGRGEVAVSQSSAPSGYRFGTATVAGVSGALAADVTGLGTVTFDDSNPAIDDVGVTIYNFLGATAPTAAPSASPLPVSTTPVPEATQLPNTTTMRGPGSSPAWFWLGGFLCLASLLTYLRLRRLASVRHRTETSD